MKKRSFKQKTVARLIVFAVLAAVFTVLSVIKNNQKVCEFFATTFSRAWIFVFGNMFGWLPFSLYEVFLVCAIAGLVAFVVCVIVFLCKHKWKKLVSAVLLVAIIAFSFLNVYTATASFAYNRNPLPETVYSEYNSDDFSYEDAVNLAEMLVEKANNAYQNTQHDSDGNIVYPFTFNQLSDLLAEEYKRLDDSYFSAYTPRGKRIVNKRIMSELHITGVFFAPFGEANINGNENNLYLPLTLAHEMAHGKGVMREYEADLVALYVLTTSQNPYLQYGALAKLVSVALGMVNMYPNSSEMYRQLYSQVNKEIWQERVNYSKYYSQFTLLKDIGNFFNDIYLKLQNQQGGTDSYVKPGETQGTGELDDFGQEIVQVLRFSGTQNLLIHLYKQGKLN